MSEITPITIGGQRGSAASALASPHRPVRSLYIHVPFCFHKCHYCDFYSFVDTRGRQGPFLDALEVELATLARHAGGGPRPGLDTIFVGGGTPSLLEVPLWERLLGVLGGLFDLRSSPDFEFTVECNPETVTPELMAVMAAGGVNRVSVGAQSFHEAHLKTLERWHDPANVQRALQLASDAGIRRRNVDLIFGIPGQTLEEWQADLERALALDPGVDHLSCYALTYEPNTPMTARMHRGDFAPIDEDIEVRMQCHTVERLREAGLERYEVSNFARPGSECRHNLAYWRHEQWLAAGPSASAHVGGWRWKNVPRLTEWMEGVEAASGYAPVRDVEEPDAARALAERIMLGLRLSEGLDSAALLREAGSLGIGEALEREIRRQDQMGFLACSSPQIVLSDRGFLFADGVAAELMGVIEGAKNKAARSGPGGG